MLNYEAEKVAGMIVNNSMHDVDCICHFASLAIHELQNEVTLNTSLPPFATRTSCIYRGDSSDEYSDPVCRRNTSLTDHHPPLLFNINNDPQELNSLNPYDYSDILLKMQMVTRC